MHRRETRYASLESLTDDNGQIEGSAPAIPGQR
jgi:hypothetical protein